MTKRATLFGMIEAPPLWKVMASLAGGALLSVQHIPQSKAIWYLFLVVIFDVMAGGLAAKVSANDHFSASKASWGFLKKFFGCLMMAVTVFIAEDIVKDQAHIALTWSLTDYTLSVMILWECGSVAQSYKKLNLPGAETISTIVEGLMSVLKSRQPVLDQQQVTTKLEHEKQVGEQGRA